MLPINLLPNYIFDKNKKRNVAIVYLVGILAILGYFALALAGVNKSLADATADSNDATAKKATYDARQADINKVQDEIATIKTKQTFIANAQVYNAAWPATLELMRNLTAHNILLKSMALDKDRKTMHMSAFAPGNSDTAEFAIANWVKALESHPDIIERVSFTVPPHPFTGMAPAGNGAPGGFGGMMGMGGSGGMMGPPRGKGGPSAMGAAGVGGAPSGIPGGAGGADGVGPAEIEGKPGINFNVNATLKTALAAGMPAPSWPAGAGAGASTGGGFGGQVGPPAGMGGPPVGMPGPGMPAGGRE